MIEPRERDEEKVKRRKKGGRKGERKRKGQRTKKISSKTFTLESMMRDLAVLRTRDLHEASVKRISGLTISVEQVCLYDVGIND